jgi:heat shock protein HslJ
MVTQKVKSSMRTIQKLNNRPVLEIFVAEKRIGGTDGCNSLYGTIETLNETHITFSKIGGTRMMCPNMELPNTFNTAVAKTSTYKIEKLHLYFYNAEGDELLKFVKVD